MDIHPFTKTVEKFSSLPEALRTRALGVGERLTDEKREELAARLLHFNERIREKEVEAERALVAAEQNLAQAEHAFRKVAREEREERGREMDITKAEEKLKTDGSFRRP